MQIEQEGDIAWVSLPEELKSIQDYWQDILDQTEGHLVLIWPGSSMGEGDIGLLEQHREKLSDAQRALVILSERLSYDEVTETINMAPTRQEARDLIDMEKMQWDLGL